MIRLLSTLLALGLAVSGSGLPVAAQGAPAAPDRSALRDLARTVGRSPQAIGTRLCVKLREGSGAELGAAGLRSRTGDDLSRVATLFAVGRASPLFTAVSRDELDRLHRTACAVLPPHNRPGHLGLWFVIETCTVEEADWLFERLWDEPVVTHVVKDARPTPASLLRPAPVPLPPGDIPPPTPLFTALQGTFAPSPLGHHIWLAQGVLGARGQGIRVEMVEDSWHLDHEDVSQCVAANFVGGIPAVNGNASHGTAGASIICADRNEYGFTGIADEVAMRFYADTLHGGIANAFLAAGANCQAGDVVMLVMMYMLAQTGSTDWVPYEILQHIFDATLTLTANGRVVVVSAANGDNDLDDPRFVRLFDRTFRDSGAVFVSASEGSQPQKAPFANFGSRIDANSWGDDVCICGVPTLFFPNNDIRQSYSADGTGTSSAVPAIAGIVAALQGAASQQLGRRLTNAEVLQSLHNHGPVSPDPIGRRPDLYGMLGALGIADGLQVDHPDLPLGGTENVTIHGPSGAGCFVFAAFATASHDLGFNRPIHLPLTGMLTLGFAPMPAGSASYAITVPNAAAIRGLSLYLQAGVLAGAGPVHVTNSGQLTIY